MAILYCVSPTWRRHTTTFWPINGLACWTVRSRRGHRNDACKWCTVGSCSANISTQRKWMSNVRHYKCHGVLSAIFQVSRVIQFPLSPLFPLDLEDYHPSVLLHCWLGHLTCKIVSEMTYNVSSGTLNPTIPYHCSRESRKISCRRFLWGSCSSHHHANSGVSHAQYIMHSGSGLERHLTCWPWNHTARCV